MARPVATERTADRSELDDFLRARHKGVLITRRADGGPQASLVTVGLGDDGDLLVATYPERAKVANLRKNERASMLVMSDDFDGEWVQVDGMADVIDVPDAIEGLVEYFRNISGEHGDWAEYRQAMLDQGKSLIRLRIERWGPIAKGGFPPRLANG